MSAENASFDRETARKELLRYLLLQVKDKQLSKDEALAYVKLLDEPRAQVAAEPIAIVGVACQFPEAENKESFWQNLVEGRNSLRDFPEQRTRDVKAVMEDDMPFFRGGFLERIDAFDPEFFGVSPQAAHHMDPYQRLMLQVLVETIEDAGYQRTDFYNQPVGVYIGNDHTHRMINNYLHFIDMAQRDFNSMTGSWTGLLAGRLSYFLNLRGPAQVIDTSCSSALVALDTAIKAIANKDCESALVGGINLVFLPGKNVIGEVENDESLVCTFDERAAGTVWGEGAAAILIKPLSKALKDGDSIYGLIKGVAVNSDGASNGITAPSSKAQQEVVLKCWERAGVNPEHISYIEAHGTGTHLGDPIEVKGLIDAFSKTTTRKQFCGLGSVKTNIGHTVGVSGLASMIKVLMSFKHQQLAPSLNFEMPNQYIDFCNSPVYINDSLRPWNAPAPRYAGISSFGLVGTNAHVVLEEYVAPQHVSPVKSGYIFPLSARTRLLLAETVQRYLDFLAREPHAPLADISYTLAVGRTHHTERAVVLASTREQLIDRLQRLGIALRSRINTGAVEGVILTSPEKSGVKPADLGRRANELLAGLSAEQALAQQIKNWPDADQMTELAGLYVAGAPVKWSVLFNNAETSDTFRRVHLPPQPFLRDRFWFESRSRNANSGRIANKLTLADLTAETGNADPRDLYQLARTGECLLAGNESGVGGSFSIANSLVAHVVCDTLGHKAIRMQENFYALGGDSISGTRVVYVLNEMLGIKAELSDLLAADSLAEFVATLNEYRNFAAVISALEGGGPAAETHAPQIARIPRADIYGLSRAQRRMYLQAQLDPDATTYNATALIELADAPLPAREQAILQQLVDRHESLRTRFLVVDDRPVQAIHDDLVYTPAFIDLREDERQLQDLLQSVVDTHVLPFDLAAAPLLRVTFIAVPNQRHFMLLDMHHIITDGGSMGIFIREYMALKQAQALPPLPITYKDFAAWDVQQAQTPEYQALSRHWLARFADGVPVIQLDTDFPRPANRDFTGATLHTRLSPALMQDLQQLARTQGCSLFTLLMAAFRVLMAKYGAGHDLTIGTPVSGRYQHQINDLIGMFVNTLVLRDRVSDYETFAQLLARVKANTLADFDYKDYAYEDLIEALDQRHVPDRNPLFDICFVLQNQDMGLAAEGALQDVIFEAGIAKFDLTVFCRDNGGVLEVNWEYATALFRPERIARLAAHYQHLLESLVVAPEQRIADIDISVASERKLLLETFNNLIDGSDTGHVNPRPSISNLFEQQAARLPHAVAIVHGQQQLTYADLNTKADELARHLISIGVMRGQAVALWFAPRIEMVIAVLAVLKAGGAYVPLDIANPAERTASILEDCAAQILLTHSAETLPSLAGVTALAVDTLSSQEPASLSSNNLPNDLTGEDLAYIMYTSGTTGKPKGASIRHKGVVRVVHNTNYLHLDESDTCMLLSNYAFDGCIFDIYGALLNGGTLVLVDKADVVDSTKVAQLVAEHGVTSMFATTSLFNMLVDQQLDNLCHLKYCIFGGEAASAKHCYRALQAFGPGRLINVYGPTECTVLVTANVIDQLEPDTSISIGRTVNHTRLYILNEQRQLMPLGCTGELYVGGDGVALGYLNRADLSAEKFVPNPYMPGDTLYRTGDLVRWQEDGSLHFVGRIDNQVKIRGFRIELGEIETALTSLPEVKQAFVTDFTREGRKFLAAYVVPVSTGTRDDSAPANTSLTAKILRDALGKTLPEYMVPDAFTFLDAMPLNANGKADRARLPEPEFNADEAYASPTTELEQDLCDIWQEMLGLEKVSVDDNFFRIGGDSIVCIQLVTRLRMAGFNLQVKDIFAAPTVAQLAKWLTSAPQGVDIVAEQGELVGAFALLPIQRWFFNKALAKPNHFNQAFMVRLPGNLPTDSIGDALAALSRQHDMLRCGFERDGDGDGDGYRQRYYPEHPPVAGTHNEHFQAMAPLQQLNIAGLSAESLQAKLTQLQAGFDFVKGPLWQAAYITGYDDGSARLFFAFHHLIVDAVSWRILAEDIRHLMGGTSLPAKTSSYRQWVSAVHQYVQDNPREADYWSKVCATELPVLVVQDQPVQYSIHLNEARTTCLLREANQGYRTEINDLLLSALALALHQTLGTAANLITLEGHGREAIDETLDVSNTVGWFTSAYPVALIAYDDVGQTISTTKEMLRAIPTKGLGYGAFAQLGLLNQPTQPLVSFNYLGQLSQESATPYWQITDDACGQVVAPENADRPVLDINGAVKHGELVFFVDSRLGDLSETFVAAFEQALLAVMEQGKRMAQMGGELTPSDFGVESLSFSRLEKIQKQFGAGKDDGKPRKKMKI